MKLYVKSSLDFYFGKEERDRFGDLISELCSHWIISKRVKDENRPYSLKKVAELIRRKYPEKCITYTKQWGNQTYEDPYDMYSILQALEGMCYNDEACEVADGFYYVGSYGEWEDDLYSQDTLKEFIES